MWKILPREQLSGGTPKGSFLRGKDPPNFWGPITLPIEGQSARGKRRWTPLDVRNKKGMGSRLRGGTPKGRFLRGNKSPNFWGVLTLPIEGQSSRGKRLWTPLDVRNKKGMRSPPRGGTRKGRFLRGNKSPKFLRRPNFANWRFIFTRSTPLNSAWRAQQKRCREPTSCGHSKGEIFEGEQIPQNLRQPKFANWRSIFTRPTPLNSVERAQRKKYGEPTSWRYSKGENFEGNKSTEVFRLHNFANWRPIFTRSTTFNLARRIEQKRCKEPTSWGTPKGRFFRGNKDSKFLGPITLSIECLSARGQRRWTQWDRSNKKGRRNRPRRTLRREVYWGGKFTPRFGGYNSLDLGAGSTKFTDAMATRQMNSPANFLEASCNGWFLANFQKNFPYLPIYMQGGPIKTAQWQFSWYDV